MMAFSGVRSSWRHVRQELRLVLATPLRALAPALSAWYSRALWIANADWVGERLEQCHDLGGEGARRRGAT